MPSAFAKRTIVPAALLLAGLLGALPVHAQLSQNMQDWMRRINSGEFSAGGGRGAGGGGRGGRGGGAGRWMDGGKAYAITEPANGGGMESVRIDTATGARQVLPAEPPNTPPGGGRAMAAGTSADGTRLLFSTNGHTVMIRKTASDYWVQDKTDNSWHKLGGKSTAGLMFAKFSPDGKSVAYLGDLNQAKGAEPRWNLYVEEVKTGAFKQLTYDASDDIIDGTSDWNNNEEFGLLDCFLWSPDGQKIAFTSGSVSFTICVMPAEGGEAQKLVAGEDPCWAPNSRTILFTRRANNKRILCLLDVPTKHVKDVRQLSGSCSEPSWAR